MKLYKDSSLTQPIEILDLGVIQAGDSKEYEFYIYNDTNAEIVELKFSIESSEVEILSYPNKLQPKEKGVLKLKYSASLTVKKGLAVPLKYSFGEIYN